ncbi:hypothetical protein PGT21_025098 [Puccinia graminis f. sp. tritici]|uniref:Uncharacterized protein n=1 Tax=Puccinia graminis f. sp. tritici TaxID=56615 RepID=A0A5B0ME60_PUCGR|nr:hypothetical protein PGT21_025098 [Puccinia graminis f. sp. tritici]
MSERSDSDGGVLPIAITAPMLDSQTLQHPTLEDPNPMILFGYCQQCRNSLDTCLPLVRVLVAVSFLSGLTSNELASRGCVARSVLKVCWLELFENQIESKGFESTARQALGPVRTGRQAAHTASPPARTGSQATT